MPKNTACERKIKKSRHINCRAGRLCAGADLKGFLTNVYGLYAKEEVEQNM